MDAAITSPQTASVERTLDVATVYAEHAGFVWASLQRLGVRPSDLEDVLQEVFVVVHQRLHTYDGSARITTWLFGVCLRVASMYRRRASTRYEHVTEAPLDETHASAGTDPEEAAAGRQARAHLNAVLDTMDLEKRAVFVMFEVEELSCERIAAVLGVPVGTIYSRLHAARKQFDQAIARWQARTGRGGVR